jgi:hypothetical protein
MELVIYSGMKISNKVQHAKDVVSSSEAGALVTIPDLNEASGQAAAQELSSAGLGVQLVQCDVRSYAAQVEM